MRHISLRALVGWEHEATLRDALNAIAHVRWDRVDPAGSTRPISNKHGGLVYASGDSVPYKLGIGLCVVPALRWYSGEADRRWRFGRRANGQRYWHRRWGPRDEIDRGAARKRRTTTIVSTRADVVGDASWSLCSAFPLEAAVQTGGEKELARRELVEAHRLHERRSATLSCHACGPGRSTRVPWRAGRTCCA